MLRITTTIALLFNVLSLFSQTGNLYFPPKNSENWETESPEVLGFCTHRIDSLYNFLEDRDTKSFILLHDGKIVLEKYFGAFTRDSFWYWASAGKSLTAFLVGQAQEEGILNISDKTSDYLGEGWTTCPPGKEALITLRHQLTMTSGLDDGVADDNCVDPACLTWKTDAGTRWAYHNGVYHLLHDVIEEASGLTIQQYTKQRLLDRVGMKGFWFDHIQYGRARDMARYGLLTLAGGIWDTDTLLHDHDYVQAMSTPSQNLNKSYGYLWWLNGQPSFLLPGVQFAFPGPLFPNAPQDLFAALGKNDQKIHVIPSRGWVIVRQGNPGTPNGNQSVPIIFDVDMWDYINALNCDLTDAPEAFSVDNQLIVMPTVATDGWNISAQSPLGTVRLINSLGQVVKNIQTSNEQTNLFISTEGLPAGAYYIACDAGTSKVMSYK